MVIKSTKDFKYTVGLPKQKKQWEVTEWCDDNFGPRWSLNNREGIWCCFWRGREDPGSFEWIFLNEKDYLLFLIKWS